MLEIDASTTEGILGVFDGIIDDVMPLLVILIGLVLGLYIMAEIIRIIGERQRED